MLEDCFFLKAVYCIESITVYEYINYFVVEAIIRLRGAMFPVQSAGALADWTDHFASRKEAETGSASTAALVSQKADSACRTETFTRL